jgi:hypothetical protein
MFEVEMVTIKGAIFGRLLLNPVCISFKAEERRGGKKYQFGATMFNQLNGKKLNKKWKLETIKEVVVKRYSLVRQAAEIYFEDSKSVFLSFFQRAYLKRFLGALREYMNKYARNIEIVEKPDVYFRDKQFREGWQRCEISNFEYLMLLNKYGGRSFNDLSQYPVFPWIIKRYDLPMLDLTAPKTYRRLDRPIGAISAAKRRNADNKLTLLLRDTNIAPFQHGTHYLPSRAVLGYLLRLEPYASLLLRFEEGQDATSRMFHFFRSLWLGCKVETSDNKELIPEFFYLPDMFANYNKCWFGTKRTEEELPVDATQCSVRVDQTIFPAWAQSHHHFVQMNALALESRQVSFSLDKWIDLVFGHKQQDARCYNRFKDICDEASFNQRLSEMNEQNVAEVQDFGSNPMQLFRDKHPSRDATAYEKRTQHAIFMQEGKPAKNSFIILPVMKFKSPVTYIEAFESRAIVVLNSQVVCRTSGEYLNVAHERVFTFERPEVPLPPFKKMYVEGFDRLNCDGRRSVLAVDEGRYLITCRHYDNSCKIVNTTTGEVLQHMYFHRVSLHVLFM